MNKKEKGIILDTYKNMYYCNMIVQIDKLDAIRELKIMIDKLELKKERYEIENEIISERDGIKATAKYMYESIFEVFTKYEKYVHYDLNDIEMCYDNLEYKMTEEERKCDTAKINYLKN